MQGLTLLLLVTNSTSEWFRAAMAGELCPIMPLLF